MSEDSSVSLWQRVAPYTVAGGMILLAFVLALRATTGLEWPCEDDFFRDMGGAQAVLDGYAGWDPAYLGETNWFNPFQPTLFAALKALTGLPLHVAYARFGPFVNLIAPLGFFLLARSLLGRGAAVAALAAFLFLGSPNVPSWFQATYSPWAWPMDFAQGLFYLTCAAYVRAIVTRRFRWDVITGVLLGFTFLAHTAPTLVFVGMIFLLTLFSGREQRYRAIGRLWVVGIVSLTVASPFLGPLLVRYHLTVLNHGPSQHEPPGFGLVYIPMNLICFRALIAAVGAAILALWRYLPPWFGQAASQVRPDAPRAMILLTLVVSPAVFLAYGLLAQFLFHRGLTLQRVLPTYHFQLYAKAAESLLFGLGLAAIARQVAIWWRGPTWESARVERWLLAGMLFAVVAMQFPGHLHGRELVAFREDSLRIAALTDRNALYVWLLEQTEPTDVFLTDMETAMWAVSAADRKVVALNDQYSNIYVNYEERAEDLKRFYASLRDSDSATFNALAAKYRLTHVILAEKTPTWCRVPPELLTSDRFSLVYKEPRYAVYRLK
jgi:hypothetical protein